MRQGCVCSSSPSAVVVEAATARACGDWHCLQIWHAPAQLVGAGARLRLASDSGGSGTIDVEWAGPIAGKPAPTVVLGVRRFWVHPLNLVGAGLPAIAVGQAPSMLNGLAPSRASPLPQWFWVFEDFGYTHSTCGSWLASDGGGSSAIDVEWAGPIAGKPAPTVVLGVRRFWVHPLNLVGAGLPAIAVGQAPSMLNGLAPSRASGAPPGPLPQWFWVFADSGYTHSTCGSWRPLAACQR